MDQLESIADLAETYNALKVKDSAPETVKIVFVRHGESTYNKSKRFSGWVDIPLTQKGEEQAKQAGQTLKDLGYEFDVCYTSDLVRAIDTSKILLHQMGLEDHTFIKQTWKLNERHYGCLQKMNKDEARRIFGREQVKTWRLAYDSPPPRAAEISPEFPGNCHKVRYWTDE